MSSELLVLLLVKLDASSIGRLIPELVTAIHSADESNLIERRYSCHSGVLRLGLTLETLVFPAKDYQMMVSVAAEEAVGLKVDSLLEGTAETFFLPWV